MKGRQRPVFVATQGFVLPAKVHPADVRDRDGGLLLVPPEQTQEPFPGVSPVWLEAGSNGATKGHAWIAKELGWTTQTEKPPPRRVIVAAEGDPAPHPAFTVLARRGVGERPCAWLGQSRRLSKEEERLCETTAALIYAPMSRLMVRPLAHMGLFHQFIIEKRIIRHGWGRADLPGHFGRGAWVRWAYFYRQSVPKTYLC